VAASARQLAVRLRAAGSVAVHRGFSDAQQALYTEAMQNTPGLKVIKRWRVTSADPCPACQALDGTEVALDQSFDASATTDENRPGPAVYRDLLVPPRHPNCRCRVDYLIT
jgi:hypothetical protein